MHVTAANFKQEIARCRGRFERIESTRVNGMAKDQKRFKDNWTKRESTNVRGYWKASNAQPS